VKGRKIHALVDTEGLPMRVVIHSAGMQDRDGAALVLNKIRNRFPWLQLVWADAGYHAHQVDTAVAKIPVLRLEIVKRSDDMKDFVVLPPLGGGTNLLLVRPQSPPRQGFREPRRIPPRLRHARLHPDRNQAPRAEVVF